MAVQQAQPTVRVAATTAPANSPFQCPSTPPDPMEQFASGAIEVQLRFKVCQCEDNPPDDAESLRGDHSLNELNDIRVLVNKTDTNRIKVSNCKAERQNGNAPTTDWLELRVSNLDKVTAMKRSSSVVHQCRPARNSFVPSPTFVPVSNQPMASHNGCSSIQTKPTIKVMKCKSVGIQHKSSGAQLTNALSDSEIIIVSDEFRRNATDHQEVVIDHKRKWLKLMKLQQQQLRLERIQQEQTLLEKRKNGVIEVNGNHTVEQQNGDDTVASHRLDSANKSATRRAASHQHRHGRKQLVIVSDEFRRDACRQTDGVVVVADDAAMSRRRQRQLQQMRKDGSQETSVDNVGNKITSHAFHSYDEEDEPLERKQLDEIIVAN